MVGQLHLNGRYGPGPVTYLHANVCCCEGVKGSCGRQPYGRLPAACANFACEEGLLACAATQRQRRHVRQPKESHIRTMKRIDMGSGRRPATD